MVDWKYSSIFPLDWITGLISRRPSSWDRVQHYGRIERGGGSISFIMHYRKPTAVSPGSQRRSEGGQLVPGSMRGRSEVVPGTSSDRPLSDAGTLERLQWAYDGAWWKRLSRPPVRFDRNARPDSSGLISMEHWRCSIVRGKRRDSGFPQKVNGKPLERF